MASSPGTTIRTALRCTARNGIVFGCAGMLTFVILKNAPSLFKNGSSPTPAGTCNVPMHPTCRRKHPHRRNRRGHAVEF